MQQPITDSAAGLTIYTIGHSTRPIEVFLRALKAFEIKIVADVRTVPRSRKNPQYEQGALGRALAEQGIEYAHLKSLGGLRHPKRDSPNTGWKNESFRGYADYMQTDEFRCGLADLICLAKDNPLAIMCAEAVPWRCHRSLIADALIVRRATVEDIMSEKRAQPHKLTPWARVNGLEITYPPHGATSNSDPSLLIR